MSLFKISLLAWRIPDAWLKKKKKKKKSYSVVTTAQLKECI